MTVALLVVGGCSSITHPPLPLSPRTSGPLVVADPDGGLSVDQPRRWSQNWWATVGGIVLCSAERVRLTSVSLDWPTAPRSSRVYLRTVSPTDRRHGRPVDTIGSALGTPPSFGESYADLGPVPGRFTRDLRGVEVTRPCTPYQRGRYTELLVSAQIGPGGADLTEITLHYRAGGARYSTSLRHWRYTFCGTAIRDRSLCEPGRPVLPGAGRAETRSAEPDPGWEPVP